MNNWGASREVEKPKTKREQAAEDRLDAFRMANVLRTRAAGLRLVFGLIPFAGELESTADLLDRLGGQS